MQAISEDTFREEYQTTDRRDIYANAEIRALARR